MIETRLTGGLDEIYGFYGPEPGGDLSPLKVESKDRRNAWVFARSEGACVCIDRHDFMTIGTMCESTLDLLGKVDDSKCNEELKARICAMRDMQLYLIETIERLHDERLPVVVVEMEGSAIHSVCATGPARLVLLDADVDGGGPGRLRKVNGERVYVHDYHLPVDSESKSETELRKYGDSILKDIGS